MENFKSKYVIVYANWRVWQSNNEWESISRLDSDKHIVTALVRDDNQLYSMVHPIEKAPLKEATSIFDED